MNEYFNIMCVCGRDMECTLRRRRLFGRRKYEAKAVCRSCGFEASACSATKERAIEGACENACVLSAYFSRNPCMMDLGAERISISQEG